jgi:NTE family protein
MSRKALVLGGGGVLGISWETGILAGLLESGIDTGDADLIVGTSAGSVVGSQIATGRTIEDLFREQLKPSDAGLRDLEFDLANLMFVLAKWTSFPELNEEACRQIGAMALASRTISEERWLEVFSDLEDKPWPERPLLVTAVDAKSGAFRAWDRSAGIPLRLAVASSCAVPGIFPPVTINGRRYVDGGVRSGTCAHLAEGYQAVLIVAPIGSGSIGLDPVMGRIARAEADALRSRGSHVELVFPDAEALDAIGINRMDATRRTQTAEAGLRQGKALATAIAGLWEKTAA